MSGRLRKSWRYLAKVIIEDSLHAEQHREFQNIALAIAELKNRAQMPWNEPPNRAPCTRWQTCGRAYQVVVYDDSEFPWKELRRTHALVGSLGIKWMIDPDRLDTSSSYVTVVRSIASRRRSAERAGMKEHGQET